MKNAVHHAFMAKRPLPFSLLVSMFVCTALQAQDYSLRYYDESRGLSHHHSSRVLQDSTGMMWIATYNGLNRFDGYQFVAFKAEEDDEPNIASDRIRRILPANDNNLFCLIDDSVFLFNTHTCRFESVPAEDSETAKHVRMRSNPDLWKEKNQYTSLGNLRFKDILYRYEDRQGNHWLIDEHGIYVATPVPTRGVCVNGDEVRAMRQLSDGCILASIRGAKQLAVYDSTMCLQGYVCPDGRVIRQPASFGSQVYCIYESRDRQSLWMGCKPGGLIEVRGDKERKIVDHYPEVRNVYDVVEDKDGNIWAATFGFGLWCRKQSATGTEPSEFTFVQGTEGMRIRRLLVTEDNTLLAATGKGLMVVRDGKMTLHQREAGRKNSLNSSALMCMAFFDGQLYIGTEGGGINRLVSKDIHADKLEFEHITQAGGLGSDIVYEFLPWSENELLVQCNNALSILHTRNGNIINYGKSFFRFIGDKPFNLGEVQPVDLGDKLLIAPLDGLLLLNKSELLPETAPVRIALSSITLEDQTNYAVDELTHLTLSPEERSLELTFAALDYRGTTDIQYQTRFYSS
ncbi:MAG: two-component regulator propeller domain-containing protein, partial [Paludibacteraceae bacterium]